MKPFLKLFLLLTILFFSVSFSFASENWIPKETLYIPHIATVYGWETKIVVDNGDGETRNVELKIYKNRNLLSDSYYQIDSNSTLTIPVLDGDCGIVLDDGENISVRVSYINTDQEGIAEFKLSNYLYKNLTFTMPQYLSSYLTWMGISIMNPNDKGTMLVLNAYDKDGNLLDNKTTYLGPYSRTAKCLPDLFDHIGLEDGYVGGEKIYSYKKVAQVEAIAYIPVCGINISGNENKQLLFTKAIGTDPVARKLYIPHIANIFDTWENYLIFNNTGDNTTSAYVTLYSDSIPVVTNYTVDVPAHSSVTLDLNDFSDKNIDSGVIKTIVNSLHVKIAYVSNTGGTAEFELNGESSPNQIFTFPGYASDIMTWEGIALFNPGNEDTTATLIAYKNGKAVGTTVLTVPAQNRIAYMLSDLFKPFPQEGIDIVRAYSPDPLCGINISGSDLDRLLFTKSIPMEFWIEHDGTIWIPGAKFIIDGQIYPDFATLPENKLVGISYQGRSYLIFNDGTKKISLSEEESARAVAQFFLNKMVGGDLSKYRVKNKKATYKIPPKVYSPIIGGPEIKNDDETLLGTGIKVKYLYGNTYRFYNIRHRWALVENDNPSQGEDAHNFLSPTSIDSEIISTIGGAIGFGGSDEDLYDNAEHTYNGSPIKTYGSVIMAYMFPLTGGALIYWHYNELQEYWQEALNGNTNILILNGIEFADFTIELIAQIISDIAGLNLGDLEPCFGSLIDGCQAVLEGCIDGLVNSSLQEGLNSMMDEFEDTNTLGDLTICILSKVPQFVSEEVLNELTHILSIISTLNFIGQTAVDVWDSASNAPLAEFVPNTISPKVEVSPNKISNTNYENESFAGGYFTITNGGNGVLNYTIEENSPWLDCDPPSGSSGSVNNTSQNKVYLYINTYDMAPGYYSSCINVINNDDLNDKKSVEVYLQVLSSPYQPKIAVSTHSISTECNEGENAPQASFEVWNSGYNTLNYTISPNVTWISCSPSSGTSTGEHDVIKVNFNTSTLTPGNHTAVIGVGSTNAQNPQQIINVSITVHEIPHPTIDLSTNNISASCIEGHNASSSSFTVSNSGSGTLNYTISDNADWLSCSPSSGTSTGEADTILVNYNTSNLNPGNYSATITISDPNATNNPQTINVSLSVTEQQQPTISLSTDHISVDCNEGENASSTTFMVRNSGSGTLNYTIDDNVNWISCSPTNGTSTGENDVIHVYFNTSGLNSGNYNGTITISDANATNNPQTIDVSLTVTENSPTIQLSVNSITANCNEGENAPPTTFTVRNSGSGTLNYTISDNADWISCSPTNGTSTGETDTITINFNTSGLNPGSYNATITVSDANATNNPQTISVSLNVSPSNTPVIELSTNSFYKSCNEGENAPSDTFTVKNSGSGTLNYTITTDANWITCSPASGTSTGEADTITVNYNTSNLNAGNYNGTITISDPNATNNPQTINVNLNVNSGEQVFPFRMTSDYYSETDDLETAVENELGNNYAIAD